MRLPQHLVQTEGDQQPVQHAVTEAPKRRGEQLGGEQGHRAPAAHSREWRVDQQQAGQAEQQAGQFPSGAASPGPGLLTDPGGR